jgi:methyl-accepting chemotaxis protein
MTNLDFVSAKLMHSNWMLGLRAFLNGHQQLSENEIMSERDCELGKWLYSKGIAQYENIPEMRILERVHTELHAMSKEIVNLHIHGDSAGAQEWMTRLEAISQKLLDTLTDIEKKATQ